MPDYSEARFYAISRIGYGKGFTADEAIENYVRIQLRNYPPRTTVFKTKAKWEAALRTGEAKPTLFHAPEGAVGFVLDYTTVRWHMSDDTYQDVTADERV